MPEDQQPPHGDGDGDRSGADNGPTRKKLRFSQRELFREVFWPRDLLPQTVPQARVVTWGYEVQIEQMFNSNSKASIFKHAKTLLSDLTTLRNSASDKVRPLVFIAHSLGGIVVKDALCLSRNEITFLNEILPATYAVLFIGTPHYGSKIASLGKLAFELSKLFFQNPNTKILGGLEVNSETLERITRSFGQILAFDKIQIHSFREELDTKGIRIVDEYSSNIGYPFETVDTIHANHRNMAKFSSIEDIGFQKVASIVRRWIDNISQPRQKPDMVESTEIISRAIFDNQTFEERAKMCIASLNRPEARYRLEDVETVYKDTYVWLFEDRIGYTQWLRGSIDSTMFWIQGKPGSGKSTAMKFAMKHDQTRKYLEIYDEHNWIIAGFSFHDRGSDVQKSILGLFREMLYQVLNQRKELFSLIDPLVLELIFKLTKVSQSTLADAWDLAAIEEALSLIASTSAFDVNLCFFVDGLDEHDGNHKDLISALRRMLHFTNNLHFRLRLCLAGRPDNIFKDALQFCPGFSLQEHTTSDIRQYVRGRIQSEMSTNITEEGEEELNSLYEEIIAKSSGIFLWVRLVVDELIEGLCEGDTLEELKELLSTIPPELEGFYTRALRRKRRGSRCCYNDKVEAYIMYQIAMCCRKPLPIDHFLWATGYLMSGKTMNTNTHRLSVDQMERRLNSRAAGLLESVPTSEGNIVEFIHQTVKTFMILGKGKVIIQEDLKFDHPRESGYVLILRYIVSILGQSAPDYAWVHGGQLAMENFALYAQTIEHNEKIAASIFFEPAMSELRDHRYRNTLAKLIRVNHNRGFQSYLNVAHDHPSESLGLFYIHSHLALSLKQYVLNKAFITPKLAYNLLHAAFKTQLPEWMPRGERPACVEALLETEVGARLSLEMFQTLDEIIEHYREVIGISGTSYVVEETLLPLWPRVRDQARTALKIPPPTVIEDTQLKQHP